MDIALVLEQLDDAKQLVQSAMEELKLKKFEAEALRLQPMRLSSSFLFADAFELRRRCSRCSFQRD